MKHMLFLNMIFIGSLLDQEADLLQICRVMWIPFGVVRCDHKIYSKLCKSCGNNPYQVSCNKQAIIGKSIHGVNTGGVQNQEKHKSKLHQGKNNLKKFLKNAITVTMCLLQCLHVQDSTRIDYRERDINI